MWLETVFITSQVNNRSSDIWSQMVWAGVFFQGKKRMSWEDDIRSKRAGLQWESDRDLLSNSGSRKEKSWSKSVGKRLQRAGARSRGTGGVRDELVSYCEGCRTWSSQRWEQKPIEWAKVSNLPTEEMLLGFFFDTGLGQSPLVFWVRWKCPLFSIAIIWAFSSEPCIQYYKSVNSLIEKVLFLYSV